MTEIHLFNPENDLALALGCRHYTPPPHAAQLHRAGALLPAWWATPADRIIAPYPESSEDISWLKSRWGIEAVPYGTGSTLRDTPYDNCPNDRVNPCDNCPNDRATPWGWSLDAKRQFENIGIGKSSLPTDDTLATLRRLSHRRSSIQLLTGLGEIPLIPHEITDPAEALRLESQSPGHYFKSPWSCSGRGVFSSVGLSTKALSDKIKGIIHRQGSILMEHTYNKVSEFGALFFSDGVSVTFKGLSMFITESRGAYTGNLVAPQDYYLKQLDSLGVQNDMADYTKRLSGLLTQLVCPHYYGWLGIDMMVYKCDNGTLHLHPCIELNLRMTMGVVAMKISERIQSAEPMLMGWKLYGEDTPEIPVGELLLPPRHGFALTLSRMQ